LTPNKIVAIPSAPAEPKPPAIVPEKEKPPVQKIIQPAPETLAPEQPIAQKTEIPNLESVEPSPESTAESKPATEEPKIALEGAGVPPHWVNIEFDIFSGAERKLIAKGLHHFASDDTNKYQISFKQLPKLDAEKTDHIKPGDFWFIQVNGNIYNQKLGPSYYAVQGALSEQFITLSLQNDNPDQSQPMSRSGRFPDAIMDRQSLIYQFMLTPPVDSKDRILLTDGKKITSFTYHIASSTDSDSIEVGDLGKLNTLHLVLTSEANEMIELWLAPVFRYAPVKVRRTDINGSVIEQLATSLEVR
jgi:hypothetical protein